MCGRYYMNRGQELQPLVEEMNRSALLVRFPQQGSIAASGEITPGMVVPVIASSRAGRQAVFPMRWGFQARHLLINARSETASSLPTFREAWNAHRCIIPASYYFEWEHLRPDARAEQGFLPPVPSTGQNGAEAGKIRTKKGRKYALRPKAASVTWLCGLYRLEEGLPVFVILTRAPSEDVSWLHDRMPLMLPEQLIGAWISPQTKPEELIGQSLTEMQYEAAG